MDRCYRQRPWELSIYNQIKRKVKQCEKMVIRLKKWIHFWTDLFDCDAIVLIGLCVVWTLLSTRKHSFADACEVYRATSAKGAIGNLNQISQMFIECAFETVVCQMVSISCWFWCGQWSKLSDKPLTIFLYITRGSQFAIKVFVDALDETVLSHQPAQWWLQSNIFPTEFRWPNQGFWDLRKFSWCLFY